MSHEQIGEELYKLMMGGKKLRDNRLEKVNSDFNTQLTKLYHGAKGNRRLELGEAGNILRAAGVKANRIYLEYDKLLRKSKPKYKSNHPYEPIDVLDLPKYINNPIAVFDSMGDRTDKIILTNLKKDGKNFIAVLKAKEETLNGEHTLEIDEITTIFPKNSKGVANWILNNKLRYTNKKEALKWLGTSPTHQEHPTTKELLSTAKLVINFENPNISESFSTPDAKNNFMFAGEKDLEARKSDEVLRSRWLDEVTQKEKTFYSSAAKAVECIKQNKATGEQWLAMLKKNGGLKAEEDKWMGLSDWLKAQKSVTKEDVLKYIAENSVEIHEVRYSAEVSKYANLEDTYDDTQLTPELAEWDNKLFTEYNFCS